MSETNTKSDDMIKDLFTVGAHIGYSKSHRHPSMKSFIYGAKNNREIIDLTTTTEKLAQAAEFLTHVAQEKGTILLLGGKAEAQEAIRKAGEATGMPYVAGRWIGGTLTNFNQIRKQVDKLESLREGREKGELEKYTKREQLSFDREIADLERYYSGLIPLTNGTPQAMVIVDPDQEAIAVHEARERGVPIVAIASTDCNVASIDYPVPANDHSKATIDYLLEVLRSAIVSGQQNQTQEEKTEDSTSSSQENKTKAKV